MKNDKFQEVESYHNNGAMPSIIGAEVSFHYGINELIAAIYSRSGIKDALDVRISTYSNNMELTITADRARELEDFFRLIRTHLDAGGK